MKVILLQDVKKQGKKDDILDVSDGYAENFLIKNGLAVKYTDGSKKRLQNELELIADLLCDNTKYNREEALNNPSLDKHVPWIEDLIEQNRNVSLEEARRIVKDSVGQIFSRVLEDAGVFKRTEKGQKGLEKFITESIY